MPDSQAVTEVPPITGAYVTIDAEWIKRMDVRAVLRLLSRSERIEIDRLRVEV